MKRILFFDRMSLLKKCRCTKTRSKETYMFDFIINLFAEIADFFITFWADNVIDKFAKRNK